MRSKRYDQGHARLGVLLLAAASAAAIASLPGAVPGPLRVCADPARAPLSSADEQGVANRMAALLADELGTELRYHWSSHPRTALAAHACDVVAEADPVHDDALLRTPAYFSAGYVLAYRPYRVEALASLDDPRLRSLRIGVVLGRVPLPATALGRALAQRGLMDNVIGYVPHGATAAAARMITALEDGTLDVALLWEPEARAYARSDEFEVALVDAFAPGDAGERRLALGLRRDDAALRDALSGVLARAAPEVDALARQFKVARLSSTRVDVAHAP